MKCKCKEDIEAKVLEGFKGEAPNGVDHSVSMHGYGFCIVDNTMVMRPYTEVTRSLQLPKKGGGFSVKRSKLNMFFSHCPFCGTPVIEQPVAAPVKGGAA